MVVPEKTPAVEWIEALRVWYDLRLQELGYPAETAQELLRAAQRWLREATGRERRKARHEALRQRQRTVG